MRGIKKYNFKEKTFRFFGKFIQLLTNKKYTLRVNKQNFKSYEFINECDFIIDVGVAYGTDWIEKFGHDKYIIYIEANPIFYDLIENKLVKVNKRKRKLIRCGAGSSSSKAFLNNSEYVSSFFERSSTNITDSKVETKIETIDRIFEQIDLNFNGLGLLKIDTEGYELEVLKGSLITFKYLKYIIVELRVADINSYKPDLLIKFLNDQGYFWEEVLDYGDSLGYLTYIDILFKKS
tara:strand:+ start:535 stop:1239 length:705 start_codon:yes stop_codon:yes gene_type:complete